MQKYGGLVSGIAFLSLLLAFFFVDSFLKWVFAALAFAGVIITFSFARSSEMPKKVKWLALSLAVLTLLLLCAFVAFIAIYGTT